MSRGGRDAAIPETRVWGVPAGRWAPPAGGERRRVEIPGQAAQLSSGEASGRLVSLTPGRARVHLVLRPERTRPVPGSASPDGPAPWARGPQVPALLPEAFPHRHKLAPSCGACGRRRVRPRRPESWLAGWSAVLVSCRCPSGGFGRVTWGFKCFPANEEGTEGVAPRPHRGVSRLRSLPGTSCRLGGLLGKLLSAAQACGLGLREPLPQGMNAQPRQGRERPGPPCSGRSPGPCEGTRPSAVACWLRFFAAPDSPSPCTGSTHRAGPRGHGWGGRCSPARGPLTPEHSRPSASFRGGSEGPLSGRRPQSRLRPAGGGRRAFLKPPSS